MALLRSDLRYGRRDGFRWDGRGKDGLRRGGHCADHDYLWNSGAQPLREESLEGSRERERLVIWFEFRRHALLVHGWSKIKNDYVEYATDIQGEMVSGGRLGIHA